MDDWILTEETRGPGQIKAWENLLAQKTFCLANPADPEQVLYCYADKRRVHGLEQWDKTYGHTQQARPVLEALGGENCPPKILRRVFQRAKFLKKEYERQERERLQETI